MQFSIITPSFRNSEVEIAFAHSVVIGSDGGYLCDRRTSLPGKYYSWVSGNLSILAAATFYRRALIERRGLSISLNGAIRQKKGLSEQTVETGSGEARAGFAGELPSMGRLGG